MNKRRILALVLACVLCVCIGIGGTLAWLTATTTPVVNTFTDSDIDITLTETGATNNANSYKMIPGYTITKDPTVTVKANSEDCYLFVKLVESDNFDDFMTYTVATGWTELTEGSGVYYRVVNKAATAQEYTVIAGNTVTVKSDVTKAQMNALTESTQPTLTVTAYASQLYKTNGTQFTAAEAWAVLNP